MSVPIAMLTISVAAALTSAARRTLAQNCFRARTRNRIDARWKTRPITSPMSSITDLGLVTSPPTFHTIEATM